MLQTKVVQKIKTHILCPINVFYENRAVYELMWKKYATGRDATNDNLIERMRFACWITKATKTQSEYIILIAFPRQQRLRERASVLRYTYTACVV